MSHNSSSQTHQLCPILLDVPRLTMLEPLFGTPLTARVFVVKPAFRVQKNLHSSSSVRRRRTQTTRKARCFSSVGRFRLAIPRPSRLERLLPQSLADAWGESVFGVRRSRIAGYFGSRWMIDGTNLEPLPMIFLI